MSQHRIEEEIEEIAKGEFEREPVPISKLKGWKSFLGMYAGEHAAGTEFMIGPFFLTVGVSAFDLIIGLLLGNFLAVLSWRFLTAHIAVKNRLTLYYQLERICGKKLVKGYNLANGILFCFLAGAMVTVSATAVGIPFNMEMPKLSTPKVTLLAGSLATLAGLFPAFAMKLLGFVALYGFILSPFGAIIVFEHFFSKKVGIVKNYAQKTGISLNKAVFWAWTLSFGLFYFISLQFNVFLSFVTFPAWLLCGVLFLVFSKRIQKNGSNK